jgi:LPXTG-site transpeptidase (sortase) family protein
VWSRLGAWRWLAMVLAGLVLLGGSAAVVAVDLRSHPPPSSPRLHQGAAPVPSIQPAPNQYNPAALKPQAPAPQRLSIPAIGVDAVVEPVDVTSDFQMGVPREPADVGWYQLGSSPGQAGDAVIDGHLDTATGAPAVFAQLGVLKAGDQIRVTLAGSPMVDFRVERTSHIPYRSSPPGLFSTDGPARLTLITCTGAWDANQHTYTERLVIEAVPANN